MSKDEGIKITEDIEQAFSTAVAMLDSLPKEVHGSRWHIHALHYGVKATQQVLMLKATMQGGADDRAN